MMICSALMRDRCTWWCTKLRYQS